MRKMVLAAAVLAVSLTACKKTGEGEYQVEKPVIGTVTDTVNTPTVNVRTDTAKVTVPNVDVRKDTARIKVPKIEINKPKP